MKDVAKRQYVVRRGGMLHFRRKYPLDVVGKFYNGKKLGKEFKKTLGTSDYKTLEAGYEAALVEFNRTVEIARGNLSIRKAARTAASRIVNTAALRSLTELDDKAITELLAPWFSRAFGQVLGRLPKAAVRDVTTSRSAEASAFLNSDDTGAEAYIQDLAAAELQRRGYKVDRAHPKFNHIVDVIARAEAYIADRDVASLERRRIGDPSDADIQRLLSAHRSRMQRTGGVERTFGELVDRYMRSRGDEDRSEKTRLTDEMLQRTLLAFFGADTLLTDIDLAKCREFRDLVVRLPANWTKLYPGVSLQDIPSRSDVNGRAPMSTKNATKYFARLKAIFEYAIHAEGWMDRNPATALKLKASKSAPSTKYVPFKSDELETLFKSPIFTGCKDAGNGAMIRGDLVPNETARYWVPLIGVYTGMRQTEICQLHAADIRQVRGIWVISVTDENLTNADEASGKNLKTRDAKRDIPIHPELERLGLVRFAKHRKKAGAKYLFSEFKPGKYADEFQKWFGRLLKAQKIKRPRLVFHSFRHGFRDALVRAGVDVGKLSALAGWKPPAGMAFHYGSGEALSQLKDAISKIDFGDVTRHLDYFPEPVK
jgi:integrase